MDDDKSIHNHTPTAKSYPEQFERCGNWKGDENANPKERNAIMNINVSTSEETVSANTENIDIVNQNTEYARSMMEQTVAHDASGISDENKSGLESDDRQCVDDKSSVLLTKGANTTAQQVVHGNNPQADIQTADVSQAQENISQSASELLSRQDEVAATEGPEPETPSSEEQPVCSTGVNVDSKLSDVCVHKDSETNQVMARSKQDTSDGSEKHLSTGIDVESTLGLSDTDLANGIISRPDSLTLPKQAQLEKQKKSEERSDSSYTDSFSRSSSTDALLEAVSSTPLQDQGEVSQEGEMMSFVAENLTEKIKMSSPMSKSSYAGSSTPGSHSLESSSSASGWSTSSASGWSRFSNSGVSRSPSVLTQSPEDIPPIDPRALMEIEYQAKTVAENVDHMMTSLQKSLHKMSGITVGCLDAYRVTVDNSCDSVDASIKSMYALMAKCEELSKSMKPIYPVEQQIREIKRLLDLFELQMARDEK